MSVRESTTFNFQTEKSGYHCWQLFSHYTTLEFCFFVFFKGEQRTVFNLTR